MTHPSQSSIFLGALLLTSIFASLSACAPGPALALRQTAEQNTKPISLEKIARATLENHFAPQPKSFKEMVKTFEVPKIYKQAKGLFVTLSKNGKTRACWGSINPQEGNLVAATILACEEALSKEYRFPPIKKSELAALKCQVTVVEKLEPVSRHASLNPLVDGLMVRSGAKAAVLLPGEASDPHYQVMQCKLKAGITPQEPCQIYRMRAHVFR
ncbi:MAG: AMMECR1 family protein [Cyanobacteria bacterium SZAS LIN-3]|nr:AMMECR1 family protein [Cyanobacteria bacterium SZAS LIN-3]